MNSQHQYKLSIKYIGNKSKRIGHYRSAERNHLILIDTQIVISVASDPAYPREESPVCHFHTFSIPRNFTFILRNLSG